MKLKNSEGSNSRHLCKTEVQRGPISIPEWIQVSSSLPCLIKEGKNSMVGCNIIGGLYGSFIHTLWHTRGSMRPLKKKYHGMDKLKKQTIKDQILKLADENINEL